MLKKRIAMEQLNGANDEPTSTDPLAAPAEDQPVAENGEDSEKPERKTRKKRRKNTGIMKVVRKKIRKAISIKKDAADDKEYEVEAIVDHKKDKGRTLYRVHWKGYSSSQDSWLAQGDLSCKDMLNRYKKKMEKEKKDVYVVEKIIDHRRLKGQIYYRVRWENYSSKDDTWQTKESLSCNELLKEYHDDINKRILEREEAKLLAKNESKNGEYEVEAILDSKILKGKTKFLIRWKGWDESDDTWEPEDTLNCPELIRKFKNTKKAPAKKIKSKKRKQEYDSEDDDDDSEDSDYGTGGKKKGKGQVSGQIYEVSKVLNARINSKGKWEFFVMWKGWGPEHNTWEPEEHLNCPKLIDEYMGKNKVPRSIQAKLEKVVETAVASTPKAKRKPPSERGTPGVGGLRGRTKGALKVLV